MPDLADLEKLPSALGALVRGIDKTNRDLALAGWSRARKRPFAPRGSYFVRSSAIRIKVFIQKIGHKIFFFFIRGPETKDVILDLEVGFGVMPWVGDTPPAVPSLPAVSVTMPSFLVDLPTDSEMKLLAKKLPEKNLSKLDFLRFNGNLMGIYSLTDLTVAQAAWMLRGISNAQSVFGRFEFAPVPFAALLEAIEEWAVGGFQEGLAISVDSALANPQHPVAKIVRGMLDGWVNAASAAAAGASNDPFDALRPFLDVRDYRGDLVLRLNQAGEIAEKEADDNFHLHITLAVESPGFAKLTAFPPDFLLTGELHDEMIEALFDSEVLQELFHQSQLPGKRRAEFEAFLRRAKKPSLVFRTLRSGNDDTEFLSFKGEWDGRVGHFVVHAIYQVKFDGNAWIVKLEELDDGSRGRVIYSDLTGPKVLISTRDFPLQLLGLLLQMRAWQKAFQ